MYTMGKRAPASFGNGYLLTILQSAIFKYLPLLSFFSSPCNPVGGGQSTPEHGVLGDAWIFCRCPGQGRTSRFSVQFFKKVAQYWTFTNIIYIMHYQTTSSLSKRSLTCFLPSLALLFPRAPTSPSQYTIVWT